jgi:hypothetical protein
LTFDVKKQDVFFNFIPPVQKPKAKSQKPKAKSQKPKAKSQKPKAKSLQLTA